MKRLFFSLYLVVVLALALIGWSSERLWQLLQSTSDNELARIAQLSKAVRLVDDLHLPSKQQKLEEELNVDVAVRAKADIAWPAEQLEILSSGEPVLMFDATDRLLIYLALNPEQGLSDQSLIVELGPIAFLHHDNDKRRLLLLISYMLLALVIALWSRPLWRDLKVLQRATESFGQGQFSDVPEVSKNSVIAPVVDTFKTMSARIARLVEEQKELTNAVSHELRTPLSRLKFSLALQDDKDSGMAQDVKELEALVDEMLSYSRLESASRELVLEKVNIHQLLQNLLDKLATNSDKQLELVCAEHIQWVCDGHFLERALQNLITNGIRYAKSKVKVTVAVEDSALILSVEDDGPGISEQEQSQIFKPFVRLDKSRTRDEGGFGLGLAIVRRIVQWHRGKVEVGTAQLGGACFVITIAAHD